jgi:hypothetical protein
VELTSFRRQGDAAINDAVAGQQGTARGTADPSPFSDSRMDHAFAYWRGKAAGRIVPRRADIDPTEIPALLPHVMLVERGEGGRYRYRLIGTENERAHGINATGCYLDEVLPGPEYRAHVLALYDECVENRRALYSECLFFGASQRNPERHTKVLFLPLSPDEIAVDMILVVQVFLHIDKSTRERHFVDTRPYKEIVHVLL